MKVRTPIQGFVFAVVCGAAVYLAAQTPPATQAPAPAAPTAKTAGLNQVVPTDPQITVGKFSNGLRYYLRTNASRKSARSCGSSSTPDPCSRTTTSAGSRTSSSTWPSTARSTFRKQDIVAFMESIGDAVRPDVNAYTSFDETVYSSRFRPTRPEIMDKALLILEDWAHNVTFDPIEVDKERGVIIEEWRLGRGAARADARQAVPGAAQGLALRGAAADRQAPRSSRTSSPTR